VSRTEPAAAQPLAIDVRGIRRVYKVKPKPVVALDSVDLAVEPGEFFMPYPVEVQVGGATVFVLPVERFERL